MTSTSEDESQSVPWACPRCGTTDRFEPPCHAADFLAAEEEGTAVAREEDERRLTARNLHAHVVWLAAYARATLEDMKGKDVMAQLAVAKESLEKLAEDFDPEPTPTQRRKFGLGPRLKSVR